MYFAIVLDFLSHIYFSMESESKETAKLDSKQAPRKTQKDTAAAARKPVSGASISR